MTQLKMSSNDKLYVSAVNIASGAENTLDQDLNVNQPAKFYLHLKPNSSSRRTVALKLNSVTDDSEAFREGRIPIFFNPTAELAFNKNFNAANILTEKSSDRQTTRSFTILGAVLAGHTSLSDLKTHYSPEDPSLFSAKMAEAYLGEYFKYSDCNNNEEASTLLQIYATTNNQSAIFHFMKDYPDQKPLALGYAIANNYLQISMLGHTQEILDSLADGYSRTGNVSKVKEYWRLGASKESIAAGYRFRQDFEGLNQLERWMDENPIQPLLTEEATPSNFGPSMQILGLFIGALGLTAVCVAFFALNVATLGLPIVATVAAAGLFALATGCTFFGVGCIHNKQLQVTAAEDVAHLLDDGVGVGVGSEATP